MSIDLVAALVLGIAAAIGIALTLRGAGGQRVTRCVLQLLVAALLYLCLFPPATREDFAAGELVLLTPGTTPSQRNALAASADVVALPDALAPRDAQRVPDLGSALRGHPDVRRLRIVGGGLPARDREAARGRVAAFDAAPLPRGLVELEAPAWVRTGSAWRISGRVEAVGDGRVELRDPSGAVVAATPLDAEGDFVLMAQAKSEGQALFALRVLDRDGASVEDVSVPLVARRGDAFKLVLFAGAPDPELKYLRRWATDAGAQVDSRIGLSEGIALTEGAVTLDADALRAADLAIVDERAWATLNAPQKQVLIAAVREGLGLLLRVTGPIPLPVAAEWAALGFRTATDEAMTTASLARALGPGAAGIALARHAIKAEAVDAAALLRADDDTPLALWRAEGQGRVALWWLADSFRLALAGEPALHASVWANTLHVLARARAATEPVLPARARVDQRAVLCGVTAGDTIEDSAGSKIALLVEPGNAGAVCAAYWPARPGWHSLQSAGARWPFHVDAADATLSLLRADDARATRTLLGTTPASTDIATRARPLPRWPLFIAWLVAIALLWWLERRAARVDVLPPAPSRAQSAL